MSQSTPQSVRRWRRCFRHKDCVPRRPAVISPFVVAKIGEGAAIAVEDDPRA
jgi:hypothetical protein